ncbi:MAG TPA: trigger factor [Myxococcales bacterium]|nr:trigger factor [Myxococcales bacterium]
MAEAGNISDDIRVECNETSSVLRSLRVEVDVARVGRAFDSAYGELRKSANIKGFRPGKVPRSVLERVYGPSLPDQVERVLVSETLAAAIETAEVKPVSEPDIDAERPEVGSPFCYTARVEVKPEIELPDLGQVEGRKPIVLVGDDEVEAEVERLRQDASKWVEEAEGTVAAEGHSLTLDFVGRIDGKVFQGGSADGADLELGTGAMIPGFEDQLVGVKAGESRQVEVSFPDDYGPDELNGRLAQFDCEVVAVRRKELPELDDEFAKDLGQDGSLDELRTRLRADLEKTRDANAVRALDRSLMESLVAICDFEVPPGVVQGQLQSQMQSMHQQFQGQVPEDVLHEQLRRMREDGRPMAEQRVREQLLVDAIAVDQGMEASSEEVDARLAEMAKAQGMDAEPMRAMAEQQGWLTAIEQEVRERKVYAYLAEHAKVVDVEPEPTDDASTLGD